MFEFIDKGKAEVFITQKGLTLKKETPTTVGVKREMNT